MDHSSNCQFISRFDLHLNRATITFVNNLAICDLTYCVVHLPIHAISYFSLSAPFQNEMLCQITAVFRNTICYATYMFIAMIAVARFAKIKSKTSILTKYRRLFAGCVWIYSFLLCSLQFFPVNSMISRSVKCTTF